MCVVVKRVEEIIFNTPLSLILWLLTVLPLLSKQSDINITNNCKNLKCPNQEDSTCVKVTYRKGLKNIAFNVIVYNKCEIGYIKCHPGKIIKKYNAREKGNINKYWQTQLITSGT